MGEYVTWDVHEEFAKRIDEERHRQNKRIELLEEAVKQNHSIALAVERMAISVEHMAQEQKRQGEHIEALERAPVNNLDTFKKGVIGAIAGAVGVAIVILLIAGIFMSYKV